MYKKLVNNYYNEFKELLKNSNNKQLKELYQRLMELDSFTREIVLRSSAFDLVKIILMEEIDLKHLEEYMIETIHGAINVMIESYSKYIFRVKLKGLEKYVTREIAIPKNFSLGDLGIAIVLAFNGECEHLMEFNVNKDRYVINPEDDYFNYQKYMFDYKLSMLDLNTKSKINFIYDFGEDYIFDVKFVKEINEIGNYPIEILKGKGFGILEDQHLFLRMYYENPNQSMLEYIGEDIPICDFLDLEEFDIDEANLYLNDSFLEIRKEFDNEDE